MTAYETLKLAKDACGVATLTLARPEKRNALNEIMLEELRAAALALDADANVRVVILAAEGKAFCAGGDLAWMSHQATQDRAGKMQQAAKLANMLNAFDSLKKPLLGRVQGPAYGGGVGLMSVCDIVIAVEDATFSLSEVKLGLTPATIGPYVVRRIGEAAARQIFFNAKAFDTAAAYRFNLVSRIVTQEALDAAIEEEVLNLLLGAPGAVADAKALCLTLARNPHIDHIPMTMEHLADRWDTPEAKEGIAAFFEKRQPRWIT